MSACAATSTGDSHQLAPCSLNVSARLRVRLGEAEKTHEVGAPPAPFDDPFAYLAAVVRGEITPAPDDLSSLELNLVVMEILDAAMTSARTGRRVDLEPARP